MNERVQQALDGDIDRFRLSPAELEELRQAEADIDAVLAAIPVSPLPDMASTVLSRIRQKDTGRAGPVVARKPSAVDWLWKKRSISFGLRPAYALAASVLIAVFLASQSLRTDQPAVASTPQVYTRFVLRIPDANSVSLAGDFTGWQPSLAMTRSGPELWTVVVPLDPGVHTYSFVIDGERWIADPGAPAVDDGFGGANSRVAVLIPDSRKL